MGVRVWAFGFQSLGFKGGFGFSGLGFWDLELIGFKGGLGLGFGVLSLRFRVWGSRLGA